MDDTLERVRSGGLELASRASSDASTVISARRCPFFLATLRAAITIVNGQLRSQTAISLSAL
jgi:hypothetical protein